MTLDFEIIADTEISLEFKKRGISKFIEAQEFIRNLPFKRNSNKNKLSTVFSDGFGTCSTKHAVLKQLAIENDKEEVLLKLGIYKMNGVNTPAVKAVLEKYSLEYLPEAHNYLRIHNEVVDCTGNLIDPKKFIPDLLLEIEIQPDQITQFKVAHHKLFLQNWLNEKSSIKRSLNQVFSIREECIVALQAAN